MAFDTRLTSTDQEQLCPRVPRRDGARCPAPRPSPGAAVQGCAPGGAVPSPLPGQHSEYSSVDFSPLGRDGDRGRGTTIQCFKALRLTHVTCTTASAWRMLAEEAAGAQPASALRPGPGSGAAEPLAGQHQAGRPAVSFALCREATCWAVSQAHPFADPQSRVPGRLQGCAPLGSNQGWGLCFLLVEGLAGRRLAARVSCPMTPGTTTVEGGGCLDGSGGVNRPNGGSS